MSNSFRIVEYRLEKEILDKYFKFLKNHYRKYNLKNIYINYLQKILSKENPFFESNEIPVPGPIKAAEITNQISVLRNCSLIIYQPKICIKPDFAIVIFIIKIIAPFSYITAHVKDAQFIGFFSTNALWTFLLCIL